MWNLIRSFRRPASDLCHLLITLDSCRMDSFQAARTPVLDARVEMRAAWSQATYTFASHASMFQGMLPHSFVPEPYYNRFVRQLWRLPHRKQGEEPLVRLPRGSRSVIDGFNRLGYFTCGTAAMAWFKSWHLRQHWQAFEWTGIAARRQVAWLLDQVRRTRRPFFGFINFGETHSPYRFDVPPGSEGDAAARGRRPRGQTELRGFDEARWRAQVACVEFLDERIGELLAGLAELGRDTLVVVCGDHGECFGEEGLYGHGFYHPKVMEVPMGIFLHRADGRIERNYLPLPSDVA